MIALGSCGGAPDRGRVVGTLRVLGGPAPGDNRGIAGTVTLTDSKGRRFDATASSTGEFSVQVPAGTYTIYGRTPSIGVGACGPTLTVVVRKSLTTTSPVVCAIE